MQYIYKIVDTARNDEVVGYIHTERDLLDFLRDVPEEAREKMDLIPAAVEKEGKSETEAPRKNANDWYWEHKDDRSLAQPRKEKVYPKYINGMSEEDVKKEIEIEKKVNSQKEKQSNTFLFFSLSIWGLFVFFLFKPIGELIIGMDVPMLVYMVILLAFGAIVIVGWPCLVFVISWSYMGVPYSESAEDHVRQKYAYKVPTTEGPTEQKQAKLQTGTSASNNKGEK